YTSKDHAELGPVFRLLNHWSSKLVTLKLKYHSASVRKPQGLLTMINSMVGLKHLTLDMYSGLIAKKTASSEGEEELSILAHLEEFNFYSFDFNPSWILR